MRGHGGTLHRRIGAGGSTFATTSQLTHQGLLKRLRGETVMALLMPVLGIEEVRAHRGWFLFMGVALIILGTIAIGSAEMMTMVSVMLLGWLLLFAGIFEVVHGFARRAWGGFFINLMGGLLYAVTGLLMVSHPGVAAVTLTFMIAMLLIVAGTFRIFVTFSTPLHHREWLI